MSRIPRSVVCEACGGAMRLTAMRSRPVGTPYRNTWGCDWCKSWVSYVNRTGEVYGSAWFKVYQ